MLLKTRQKIAIARLAHSLVRTGRGMLGLPMQGMFSRQGLKWWLDLDEGIDFSIYLLGSFEPSLVKRMRQLVRPGDVVCDIGANVGAHTLPLARQVGPQGRVLAIEATAYGVGRIQRNLSLNPELEPRADVLHMILAEAETAPRPDTIYARWPLQSKKGSSLHPVHLGMLEQTGEAHMATLDEALAAQGVHSLAWIKLDVDGNELSVLRGATETLSRLRPKIVMELAPDYAAGETRKGLREQLELLAMRGYRPHRLDGAPLPADPDKLEALIGNGASINALMLPL